MGGCAKCFVVIQFQVYDNIYFSLMLLIDVVSSNSMFNGIYVLDIHICHLKYFAHV